MSYRRTPVLMILAALLLVPTVASQAASTPYIVSIIDRDAWIQADSLLPASYADGGDSVTFCIWVDPATGADDFDGGFDFLIRYDADALWLLSADRGGDLHSEWEYFSFRTDSIGLLRVVGLCNLNDGVTPSDEAYNLTGCIVEMTFAASMSPAYAGLCHAIEFYTIECGDNVLSSRMGDSLYLPASGVIFDATYDSSGCPPTGLPYVNYTGGELCISGTNEPPDTLPDPYSIAIINRDTWVQQGTVEHYTMAPGGENTTVCLWVDPASGGERSEGGFDFLVCYDETALTFMDAYHGADLHPGWEYFTWRSDIYADSCPSIPQGLVRIVGIADMLNTITPPDEAFALSGCIAELVFSVSDDPGVLTVCPSIGFCAFDCGDNAIASRGGDSLYIPLSGVLSCNGYDPAACLFDSTGSPMQAIEFTAGAVCIIPPPPLGGDINLNGIGYEIGDAVLFTNYFIYGTDVFIPSSIAAQIAETETNCDNQTMSTVDLSYLINVIIGELQLCNSSSSPRPSRHDYAASATGPVPSSLDTMMIISTSAAPGETFSVDLYLRNVDTLGVFNFRLRYDPTQITPLGEAVVVAGDTMIWVAVEQLRGQPFEVLGASTPFSGVLTFLASDFTPTGSDVFLPGNGATVRMSWMVIPTATDPFAVIAFEGDPAFPQSFNTMADIHAAIWKRPVLVNGSVNIGGAVCDCPHQGDMDADGFITAIDLGVCIDALFGGGVPPHDPDCPVNRLDLDCSGYGNAIDLAILIDHLFAGQPGPCNPCTQ